MSIELDTPSKRAIAKLGEIEKEGLEKVIMPDYADSFMCGWLRGSLLRMLAEFYRAQDRITELEKEITELQHEIQEKIQ